MPNANNRSVIGRMVFPARSGADLLQWILLLPLRDGSDFLYLCRTSGRRNQSSHTKRPSSSVSLVQTSKIKKTSCFLKTKEFLFI